MRTSYKAERPLQVVVVDHAKVDILVIDDRTQECLGRPWLTIAIDVFTRMATGFHLAMTPPSRISVSMCLLHSVCGKNRWLSERRIDGIWPIAGVPETLRLDAQSFYGLRDFGRSCANMEIETLSGAPREHKYGAHVEALIGSRIGDVLLATDQDLMMHVNYDRCETVSERYETLPELERHLGRQIVQRYHFQRHQALQQAPISVWREHEDLISLRAPANCLNFRLSFMPEEDCPLDQDGVRLLERKYSSRGLRNYFNEGVKRVIVKYDPRDLSNVFVETASGRYLKIYEQNSAEMDGTSSLAPCANEETSTANFDGSSLRSDRAAPVSVDAIERGAVERRRSRERERRREREPPFEIGSVELIERRCASSCPFGQNPRRLSAEEGHVVHWRGSN
jgi:putative transposase